MSFAGMPARPQPSGRIPHNRRMDRYERILALHRTLQAARYPVTVARLQDELGCSRATVYRDLAFLRDALMAPIIGDGEAGFRYDAAEADRFELPGLWLSTAMGARGLTLSLLCAELLAARLHGEPLPLDVRLARALGTERLQG